MGIVLPSVSSIRTGPSVGEMRPRHDASADMARCTTLPCSRYNCKQTHGDSDVISFRISGAASGEGGKLPQYGWTSKKYVICVCFIVMELLRITRQIHCKAVEQRATLIHRLYNRDWGTSYSRPPIDPHLTSPLLQNPGGATDSDVISFRIYANSFLLPSCR